ncbi:MAG TPA: hypothetical protein PK720_03295 [bacterium]|jgi:hypothetical protein|nr:hypothetical protein [bacterium]
MSDRLQRLIHLINKTGDKLIVFDENKEDNCYVISSLSNYEGLVHQSGGVKGLTEDELIDKINRDIAVWKSDQAPGPEFSDFSQEFEENQQNSVSEERVPTPIWSPPKASFDRKPAKNSWTIPESRLREADSTS